MEEVIHKKKFKNIEGFNGPFIGKYLKGFSPQFKNRVFNTINDTLLHFHKDDFALGITLNRNGKYTIRRSNKLINSPTNTNGNTEISWIFIPPKKINNNTHTNNNNNHNNNNNNNKTNKNLTKISMEIIKINNIDTFFNPINMKLYNKNKKLIGKIYKGNIRYY